MGLFKTVFGGSIYSNIEIRGCSMSPIQLACYRLAWLLTLPKLATTHTLLSSRSLLLSKAGLRCNSRHTSRLYFLWNCPSMATLVPSISPKHHTADFLRLNNTHESSLLKVLFSPLYVTCIPGKIQVSLLLFPKVPLHSGPYPRVKGQGQACVCIY